MSDEFDVNELIENETNPKIIENATNPKIIENETTTKLIEIDTEPSNILDQTDFLFHKDLPEPLIPINDITKQDWFTEIVHLGTKDDCSIMIKIGERLYKTLWDSGAGKCVISYDKYQTIPKKFKTPLVQSNILIKAANGSIIENKGECDITFRIGHENFTFTFLVSNALTQDIILGYNFSKAYHIGTNWNKNDEMYLTRNGKQLTTTVGTKSINAIVQCAEVIVIPPKSNAMVKCRAPNISCQEHFEKICLFEPSSRHKSENSACHTYNGTVLMDNEVVSSGIFEIVMTNTSYKTVKIRKNTNMGLLKSCMQEQICTIHEIITFETPKGKTEPEKVKKNLYSIPFRTKSGEIVINTVTMKEEIGINEIGPQEDFVKFVKPKLQNAPVNAKVLKDLEKLLNDNPNAFATDETEIGTTPLIEMDIDTGTYYESNQPTMPAARENVAAGGRAKECSPKTEDCSDGARPKDECDRRANGANSVTEERFAGSCSGSGPRTPKDGLKTRERYCLLFGVEKIPRPRERPGSRAVPPYAWTDLIIWDYVSPYIPGLTQVKALNAMEFLAFRGSRTNKEGIPQGEAMALADGLDGNEVLWVGKPVVLHCSPRTLTEGAADLAASRDYVRKRTHDRINKQRANAVRQAQRQRMEEMPRVCTPRGRGMGRRADRQAAEQTLRHHVAARDRDQPLYAARDTPERDQVGRDRLDE